MIPKNYMSSFFSSSFPLGTCNQNINKKQPKWYLPSGSHKNNATIDNHQTIQAYHQAPRKISQDNRDGQASQ
jgi:hypothetical protein